MAKKPLDTSGMLDSPDDFAAAYESHAKQVYKFLFWRTRDSTLSDDLTSDVFEKAWRKRDSFKGGSVQAWLYRIARNTLTDHWRKKKDIISDDVEVLAEPTTAEPLAEKIDAALTVERLTIALDKLPKNMRDVVKLRFIEGYSSRQIAKKLSMSESNVRVMQYRALKKLRIHLQ